MPTQIVQKRMRRSKARIPDEVLREVFPQKLNRSRFSEEVYTQLKKIMLSGKLEDGKKLTQGEIAHTFNVSMTPVNVAYSRLEKDGLITIRGKAGSFVTRRFKKPR